MKPLKLTVLCLSLFCVLFFSACKKNELLTTKQTEVTIAFTDPKDISNVILSNTQIVFKEINSGTTTSFKVETGKSLNIQLPEGSYDVSLDGDIDYVDGTEKLKDKVSGYKQGLLLSGSSANFTLPLFISHAKADFVIKEVFFTGTVTPESKAYNGDKYFIIYNNSNETLYADGLVIAEAAFLSITKREYTPDVMSEAFSAGSLMLIPGDGKNYPVLPGKQIVVANNAINHLEYNVNSLDLSNADFEIPLLASINVDNPQVTDLIGITSSMTMHNRGFKSYVLARLAKDQTVDGFKKDNFYTYGYVNAAGNISNSTAYKIPNTQIIDAVNLSIPSGYQWILTDPSLDKGYSYCGKVDQDASRYGKSVRRKVSATVDGRDILKDTNNSTLDFEAESKPSLMK
ncbi:DUF4876 domain-containing protein [Pedobacter sp.]|uniref:DUF4876 domain-containing protein n=1 Tax=Pedobacter sp. TaxID=1411316 RepID=UPI003D7F3EEC